jgi:hypothetical protein
MSKLKAKNRWIPVFALIVCFFLFIILFDNIGLTFFNALFGNNTYAIKFSYEIQPVPSSEYTKSLKFLYTVDLVTVRVPIETRLTKREIKETGDAVNMTNRKVTITFPITVTTQTIQLFSESFTFYDTKPREFTIYLDSVQKGDTVNFVIKGTYILEAVDPIDIDTTTLDISISKVFTA